MNQKLKRYDIGLFRSRVNKSGTISYVLFSYEQKNRSSLSPLSGPVLVSTGDTTLVSMITSNVEVQIRPNCTS